MSQSLGQIYLHLIFHIKSDAPVIRNEQLEELHTYIGGLINKAECQSICVGGVADHVHILFRMSRVKTVAGVVEFVKMQSTKWLKAKAPLYSHFAWQGGYAVYSVSSSLVEKTRNYIYNQASHHKKMTFREEYLQFLKLYHVEYNEKYIFTDD